MNDPLVISANVACWGILAIVWTAGAVYNAARAPRKRVRRRSVPARPVLAAFIACSIIVVLGQVFAQDLVLEAAWLRVVGLILLLVSTAFAVWARLSLGTLWSVNARVGDVPQLRTGGPYAVTRHPIYTGVLGMLLGSALLNGIGVWIVLVAIGVIGFGVKIHEEEQLLLATFPAEYPGYRQRVPQLVPGLNALPRRRSRRSQAIEELEHQR